ncbi:hypothetical protein QTQ03_02150 [Micromonospora sp. WMMA1363]|uniref:hypothetical protein n=1 Tax=Micromonospora sp. WMMA1363 TaxID=3053985 RepID=UPI00259D119A|nr:hypothetical protein [Micromonospora sp. WMMA1363]MDM4718451.1 hypothetical protein [Micromonospora sp. WMMA1363]
MNGVELDGFYSSTPGVMTSPVVGDGLFAGRRYVLSSGSVGYADAPQGTINHLIAAMDIPDGLHQVLDGFGWDRHVDTETDRIHRLLDGLGWSGSRALDAPLSELLSPRWDNHADGWEVASGTAGDAGGVLMMGPAGEVTYHSRHRRVGAPVRWTLTEWTPGLRFALDDSHVHNSITAERSTGLRRTAEDQGSIAQHGVRALTIRRDVADPSEVQDAASWTLHRYRDASPRCDTLRVQAHTLTGDGDAPQRALAASADVSDRLALAALPPSAPAPALDCFVEGVNVGIVRNGTLWEWTTEFTVSDAGRSDGWVLEGPSGRLDTETCIAVY